MRASSSNATPPSVNETRKTVHPSSSNPAGSARGSIDDKIGCPNRTWHGLQCTSIMLEIERSADRPIPKRPKLSDSARLVLNHGIAIPSTWRSRISPPLWLIKRSSSRSNNRTSDAPASSAFCRISASPAGDHSKGARHCFRRLPGRRQHSPGVAQRALLADGQPRARFESCTAHRRMGYSNPWR